MVLIDTNILVFLLLRGERTNEARALFEVDSDWRSESFLLVEFSNVLASYVRSRELTLADAKALLDTAARLMQARLINVDHGDALDAAHQFLVSAYDARFLVLARQLDSRLVTEDVKLRRAAPDSTQSIAEALRSVASK